jgi:hypothetical protein
MFESRRVAVRGPLSPGLRFALVGVVAAIGLAGCGSTTSSSASTSATPSVIASSTVIPSATPALSPTPAPPVSFVATGSMHAARSDATATLLKNGKVLIAGGNADHDLVSTVYASSELYDPATGKFTKTGSMTAARTDATASLLPDGRVLIVGGEGCSDPKHCTNVYAEDLENLVSAEIYDPATGKFVRTGSMVGSTPNAAAAVLMPDDRVLFVGQVAWGELYDAATGKFVRTGNVGNLGGSIIATLLPDGKVLVTGAYGAHLYDETSGKFTTISLSLPAGTPSATYKGQAVPRDAPYTATLLPDGRVLLFEGGYLATYDPATGACTDAGFISPGGEWIYPTATLLPDGTVLFEGGELKLGPDDESSGSTNAVVLYDPTSGHARMGSTQVARLDQTATLLPDGSVLIAGGEDKDGNVLASAELFKP